jgi:hypothetical protein
MPRNPVCRTFRLLEAVLSLILITTVLFGTRQPGAEPTQRVAVFDFEIIDTSLGNPYAEPRPENQARLRLITDHVRRQLEASEQFEVVDTAPAAAELERAGYIRVCNGCEVRIAARLGADLALVGWVHKVSNLILSVNMRINRVTDGEVVFLQSVDIRGDTDEAWLHGVRWLLENRLFRTPS